MSVLLTLIILIVNEKLMTMMKVNYTQSNTCFMGFEEMTYAFKRYNHI